MRLTWLLRKVSQGVGPYLVDAARRNLKEQVDAHVRGGKAVPS